MENVILEGIGVYIPKTEAVDNSYFVEHFKKEENGNKEVQGLMDTMKRGTRYFASKDESSLTMGYNAAVDVLEKNGVDSKELDMIVFVSTTPEYTSPTDALKLNHMLGAENAHNVFDMNCNCTGMLVALDTVSTYMKLNKNIRRALIVSSMLASSVVRYNDSVAYPCFGDASTAVILKKVKEEHKRGFIDSIYRTYSDNHDKIQLPECGHSNERMGKLHKYYRRLNWIPFDSNCFVDIWTEMLYEMMGRNDIKDDDVACYAFSQFHNKHNVDTLNNIGADLGKYPFNGDRYGYTACSSPILALSEEWDRVKECEGKHIIFCSVAAGLSYTALTYKI